MPRARSNGIEIEYETFGSPSDPTLLLVMGLGAQMILWDDGFCRELADRGFHVVRYDNRDVGASTRLEAAGVPDIPQLMAAATAGRNVEVPYRLHDMALDAVGLLDALGADRAHVVGASMGGMIAQLLAIGHAGRVASLTSIMSTTGEPELPGPTPEAMEVLLTPPPTEREAFVAHHLRVWHVIGSPELGADEGALRERAARIFDRGLYPPGVSRHLAAILASGGRRAALERLALPALVIHGESDPLVPFACGRATADAIPGADLLAIPDMGHDLPAAVWKRVEDGIERTARRAMDAARSD